MTAIGIGVLSVAIFLILLILSRNYLLSFFGFLITALCFLEGSIESGCIRLFTDGIYGQLLNPEKASMIAFIALYCGYVGTMEYGGAIKGFTRYMTERGRKTKISVQQRAWIASVAAFFSDLGSPGIVGTLFRKEYDDAKLSRERLGLLINLTAVPVCSMIPLVGWGLFAIGIINNTVVVTGYEDTPIRMFFYAIPYYCLPQLAIITPLLLQDRHFVIGSLRYHDREAEHNGSSYITMRKKAEVVIELAEEEGKGFTLFLSLVVMFGVLLFFLKHLQQPLLSAELFPFMVSLGIAFIAASLAAMLLVWLRGEKSFMRSFRLYTGMFKRTLSVTGIMTLSWAYFEVAWRTQCYQALTTWLSGWLPAIVCLPLVFMAGAGMSSLTGSAWGTYAVIMPFAILLCQYMNISVFAGIGATVSAGVYGDIFAKNSHAMHYSAESAGVYPKEFREVQKPYMHMLGFSCVVAYGLGALADRWYIYVLLAIICYVTIIYIKNHLETKKED